MKPEDFEKIMLNRIEICKTVLLPKGLEYSRNGDRLHNFKEGARKRNLTDLEYLMILKEKHTVSLDDIVNDAKKGIIPTEKQIEEHLTDELNYWFLWEAVLLDTVGTKP